MQRYAKKRQYEKTDFSVDALALCGRRAGPGEIRNQIDRRHARNGRPTGQTGFHRPLCRLVSPVPDDGTGGVLAQGRGRIHGPAVRSRQIQHRQAHGPRTDEEIRQRLDPALPRVRHRRRTAGPHHGRRRCRDLHGQSPHDRRPAGTKKNRKPHRASYFLGV